MLKGRWVSMLMVLGFLVGMQSCGWTTPEGMVSKSDHEGLANYYAQQAQELKVNASRAESMADLYEKLAGPNPTGDEGQRLAARAVRSRAIAQDYRKAAEEAEGLAADHRALRLPPRTHQ